MKTFLINFMLFFYTNYIMEDWDELNKFGKIFIYPFWFIKSTIMWIISPLFVVDFLWRKSELYKEVQKMNEQMLNFKH